MTDKDIYNSFYNITIKNNNLFATKRSILSNKNERYKNNFITKTLTKKDYIIKPKNLIFIRIILYIIFIKITKEEILSSYNNEIIIKVKGTGPRKFIQKTGNIEKICSSDNATIQNNLITFNNNNDINEIKIEINLKDFSFDQIFLECSDVTEIDLSNFNTSSIKKMNGMFQGCTSLTSINFNNFDTSNIESMENMFSGCSNLISLNLSSFNLTNTTRLDGMFKGCSQLNYLDISNFNALKIRSIENMFFGCSSLQFLKFLNFNTFENINVLKVFSGTHHNLLICTNEKIRNYLYGHCVNDCGSNWNNLKEKISLNFDDCNGPFQDTSNNNNNCNEINAPKKPTEYCYSKGGILISIINDNKKTEYIVKTNNIYINPNTNIPFYSDSVSHQTENTAIYSKTSIINDDIKSLLSKIINHKKDFGNNNFKYQISTISNQSINNNFTFIDLSSLANCLQTKYGINNINDLIIFKIENKYEGIRIPILEYEIYKQDGEKLELDKCSDYNVTYYISMNLSEREIYMMNPESNFYNDRCDKYTSENKTDMTLYDRKNEYNIKNLSLCESNCTFKEYDFNTSRIKCDCKLNAGLNRLDNINQEKLLNQLDAKKNTLNLDVMECTQILSSSEDIKTNPGFYLLIFILIIFLIIFIIFFIKGRKELKKKIENVINKYFNKENINNKKNIESNKIANNKRKLTNRSRKENKKLKKNNNITKDSKFNMINDKKGKDKKQISSSLNKENLKENVRKLYETDYELNNALYADAKKYDKRSGCTYYCSLLQYKQIFIFTFLNFDDYNSGIIKKYIFFLSFALHYTINALFFNDSNMHQIFQDQGSYNIKYQFPFIFISALLSIIILRLMLIGLILNDKNIFEIKCQPNIIKAKELKKKTLKNMNIKFIIFFVLNLVILILFWFYLTCWNAIYQNTKVYLIKNTFISFGISLVYPFLINIFPVILRMNALKNNKKQYLYKVSKIVQLL